MGNVFAVFVVISFLVQMPFSVDTADNENERGINDLFKTFLENFHQLEVFSGAPTSKKKNCGCSLRNNHTSWS